MWVLFAWQLAQGLAETQGSSWPPPRPLCREVMLRPHASQQEMGALGSFRAPPAWLDAVNFLFSCFLGMSC